jgi:hypothetical protein
MRPPNEGGPRKGRPDTTHHLPTSYNDDEAERALAEIRRWENSARLIADDPGMTLKAKCLALLDMMARARRSEFAAFLERAVWKGCAHLFEEEPRLPSDTIGAIRALLRRGHEACPTCLRPLPDYSTLDYWRRLTHEAMTERRSA